MLIDDSSIIHHTIIIHSFIHPSSSIHHHHRITSNIEYNAQYPSSIKMCPTIASRMTLVMNRTQSLYQRSSSSISTLNHHRGKSQKVDVKNYLGSSIQESLFSPFIYPRSKHYLPQTINPTPSSIRSFSASNGSRKTSRRRRAGSGVTQADSEVDRSSLNAPSSSSIVEDEDIFLGTVRAYLDKVEEALEPMKAYNEVFKVKRDANESGRNLTITLKPGEGQYIFQVDNEMKTLTLNSPMSGTYTYVLCGYTDNFVGINDGHLCEGMLVRDMIRHCNGLPKF